MKHKTLPVLAALAVLGITALHAEPSSVTYRWTNVKVGGGGFSPGIVFSQAECGLAYLRTDIGGLYRWDAAQRRWLPLQDSTTENNQFGIESVAPDPHDANVVYAAAGMYESQPAAILRSDNRGASWSAVPVPFRTGGNEDGRGLGERLAVDPNDGRRLLFGSRNDGLQASDDRGKTWHTMATFGAAGPPSDGHARGGIAFVAFDPSSGSPGAASRRIFIGLAEPGPQRLYRSDDAGKSWQPVANAPRPGLLPVKAALDAQGNLFVTYANGIGPSGVTDGAVFRLDTRNGTWSDITPASPHLPGGYMGLGVDAKRPGSLVVATLDRYATGDTIWRSTDFGKHWTDIRPLSSRDVSATPFLKWGSADASFGWWIAGLAIDPCDSGHAAYTTGATVYATDDLAGADRGATIHWRPWVDGVEETAIIALASPPEGPHLLSGFGDIGGFAHDDLAVSPPAMFTNPIFANTNTIDFAGMAPNVVVRSGTPYGKQGDGAVTLAYSLDGGHGWQPLVAPPFRGKNEQGVVEERRYDLTGDTAIAVSADGAIFMAMTPVPLVTGDRGKSWALAKGLPVWARPIADRVDPQRFYALDFFKGQFYASDDGGRTFAPVASSGLPIDVVKDMPTWRETAFPLMATPGRTGDLWFLSRGRLLHSTDGGRSFREVVTYMGMEALAFGKAAPGADYPALYTYGWSNQTRGVWRSDDIGKTWVRINDAEHEYGRGFRSIAADPRLYGRVYLGTNGRGILYGDPR